MSSKGNPLGHPRWRVEGLISLFTVEDEAVRPVKASCGEKKREEVSITSLYLEKAKSISDYGIIMNAACVLCLTEVIPQTFKDLRSSRSAGRSYSLALA